MFVFSLKPRVTNKKTNKEGVKTILKQAIIKGPRKMNFKFKSSPIQIVL